jgi:endonuclease/exonuclease/phosphatase family metal-dependent hydrolase
MRYLWRASTGDTRTRSAAPGGWAGLALAACALSGCGAGAPPAPLRVMTFNVRYGTADDGPNRWELRRELLVATIRRNAPDILATQEGLRWQLDEIESALPELGWVGVGRDDGGSRGEHAALFYRRARLTAAASGTFWLSDTPSVPGSTSWGNALPRICTWARLRDTASGRALVACNVHLDHESQVARERGLRLVLDRAPDLAPGEPLIVLGDLNLDEENPALELLRRGGLTDTWRAAHPAAKGQGTFHDFTGRIDGPRVDFIWASPHLRTLDAAIDRSRKDGRCPSDHDAVTAILQLQRAPVP